MQYTYPINLCVLKVQTSECRVDIHICTVNYVLLVHKFFYAQALLEVISITWGHQVTQKPVMGKPSVISPKFAEGTEICILYCFL